MEVLNDLLGYENLKIYQNPDWFSFSLDSVLLPNFVTLRAKVENIIDLGTGNLLIPLFLSTRPKSPIVAVEIQEDVYQLAYKTLQYNHLENQITLLHMDIKDLPSYYSPDSFDVVVSNPPYFRYHSSSNINEDIHKTIARHEKMITLEELISVGSFLLKNKGVFAMVHRSERFLEICQLFEKYHITPKRVQFVYPKEGEGSNLVLIEGMKNGKSGLKVLPPFYVHYEDGSYRKEVLKLFERESYETEKL